MLGNGLPRPARVHLFLFFFVLARAECGKDRPSMVEGIEKARSDY